MDSNKPVKISDLSVEELLSQAEIPPEPGQEAPLDLDDVSAFISANNIQSGEHKVRKPFFYEYYKEWSKDPVGQRKFHSIAVNYLDHNTVSYFLDQKAFVIVDKIRTLAKAKAKDPVKNASFRNHAEFFFASNGIKRGDFYLSEFTMYTLYKTWCVNNGFKIKFKQGRFTTMCKHYFVYKVVQEEHLFRVTTGVLKYLSKELLEKINKNEKNKKKPPKIPLFKPGI